LAIAHLPVSVEMDCAKLVPETGPFPRLVRSTEPAGLRFRKKSSAQSVSEGEKIYHCQAFFLVWTRPPLLFSKGPPQFETLPADRVLLYIERGEFVKLFF
jgi:hypothetical protein